jgi:hypothetical protein
MNARGAIKLLMGLAAAVTGSAWAAENELARIEQNYREKREAIVRPLLEAYTEKLKSLQETLTRRGDYNRAQAVQNERNRVVAGPGQRPAIGEDHGKPPEVPAIEQPPADGIVVLTPEQAAVRGGAQPGVLATLSFSKKGEAGEWPLPKLLHKRYRVVLHYWCGESQGGRYQLAFAGLPARRFSADPAPSPIEADLGEYEFSTSPTTVTLEVVDLNTTASRLMNLQRISLRPANGPANGNPSPATRNAN